MLPPEYSIRLADSTEDFHAFAKLALDYQQWLSVDLCFQVRLLQGLNNSTTTVVGLLYKIQQIC